MERLLFFGGGGGWGGEHFYCKYINQPIQIQTIVTTNLLYTIEKNKCIVSFNNSQNVQYIMIVVSYNYLD